MSDTDNKELKENAMIDSEFQEQGETSSKKKIKMVLKDQNVKQLENFIRIPLDKVIPDPDQPRKVLENDPSIPELAESIKKHGLLSPVHVRYIEERDIFQIINGERRYLAFKKLKRKYISAILFEQCSS